MTKCNAIIMNIVSILSKWHNFRLNSYRPAITKTQINKVRLILHVFIQTLFYLLVRNHGQSSIMENTIIPKAWETVFIYGWLTI